MTQALQFTVNQVARHLDLSESVVNRLSQYFQMPASYYQTLPGQPRLHLYQAQEVEFLYQAKQMLVAGKSLPEIKAHLGALPLLQAAPSIDDEADLDDWDDDDDEDLMEYEENHRLKEQLADVTFKQYRLRNTVQKPPFKALVETLDAQKRLLGDMEEIVLSSSAATYLEGAGPQQAQPMVSEAPFSQPYVNYSWITPELQQRAMALRDELLKTS